MKTKKTFKRAVHFKYWKIKSTEKLRIINQNFKFILKDKKFKNYKLYILGEGRDRNKISSLIDHLNLRKMLIYWVSKESI